MNMATFKIVFTSPDSAKPAAVWPGYESYTAARRALADADQMIPIHWDHEILEDAA